MRCSKCVALLGIAIALLTWAFFTRGKEGMFIFFSGAATLLCTLFFGGLRMFGLINSRDKRPRTNISAIPGGLIGLFLGGFLGVRMGFGHTMISLFNPDLSERDFGASFGTIGGGIRGAFLLALIIGILQTVIVRPQKAVSVEDTPDASPDSRADAA